MTGKGQKMRVVPVGKLAAEAIQAWLKIRSALAGSDEKAFFVSQRGGRLAARTVQARLKKWALARGAPMGVHPHMLRHSFASHLLESSGNLAGDTGNFWVTLVSRQRRFIRTLIFSILPEYMISHTRELDAGKTEY